MKQLWRGCCDRLMYWTLSTNHRECYRAGAFWSLGDVTWRVFKGTVAWDGFLSYSVLYSPPETPFFINFTKLSPNARKETMRTLPQRGMRLSAIGECAYRLLAHSPTANWKKKIRFSLSTVDYMGWIKTKNQSYATVPLCWHRKFWRWNQMKSKTSFYWFFVVSSQPLPTSALGLNQIRCSRQQQAKII
jgi:hypothetical protein